MVLVLPFFHCWFLYRPCPATHQNPLRSSRFIVLLCAASSPLRNSREGSPLIPSHQTPEYPLVTRCLALVTLGELCPLEPLVETQAGIVGGCSKGPYLREVDETVPPTVHRGPPCLDFLPEFRRMYNKFVRCSIRIGRGLLFLKGGERQQSPCKNILERGARVRCGWDRAGLLPFAGIRSAGSRSGKSFFCTQWALFTSRDG